MNNFLQIGSKIVKLSDESAKELEKQFTPTGLLTHFWDQRLKLRAEGSKLYAEGRKLCAEADKLWAEGRKLYAEADKLRAGGLKLWAEGRKLYAEADKLRAEGSKLRAEGRKLWAEADILWSTRILEYHGNIQIEWKTWNEEMCSYNCHLENGDIYEVVAG